MAREGRYDVYGCGGGVDPKFMSEHEEAGRPRKQRSGACHRCGWKRPVSKIGRNDRRRLQTGRSFGRLCDECIDDLIRQLSAGGDAHAPRRRVLDVLRHHDVA